MNFLDLILDETSGKLMSGYDGRYTSLRSYAGLFGKHKIPIRLSVVKQAGGNKFAPVDWSSDTVKVALATLDGPTSGEWRIGYNGGTTAATTPIKPGMALSSIEEILNNVTEITTDEYVYVRPCDISIPISERAFAFDIHFREPGARAGTFSFVDESLFPPSAARITTIQEGSDTGTGIAEVVRFEVMLENIAEATLSSGTGSTVTVATPQAGGTDPEVQTITIDPIAIDGFALWTVDSTKAMLPINATARELNNAFSSATFHEMGTQTWHALFAGSDDKPASTVSLTATITPNILETTIDLDTTRMQAMLSRQKQIMLDFQINIEESGGNKKTVYSEPVTIYRDHIIQETVPS